MEVKDLFVEVKKVLAAYKEQASKLDDQERELNAELFVLQEEMTSNILDQETAGISEKVYLKIRSKEINSKTEIINKLLEELDEERTSLKLSYIPLLREARVVDGKVRAEYDANEIVNKYKWLMISEIAEIGKEIQKQYWTNYNDLMEILDDPKVNEVHRNVKNHFSSDSYKLTFTEANKTVVHREDIRWACGGNLPVGLKKPEGIE